MNSPFNGTSTQLRLPREVTPGVPFRCYVNVVNQTDERVLESRLRMRLPNGIRAIDGSLGIDERGFASRIDRDLSLLLAPFAPGQARTIRVDLVLDASADTGEISMQADISTPDSITTLEEHSRVIASTVDFTPEQTFVDIVGERSVRRGDVRDATLVIVNEGSAIAHDAQIDLGLIDIQMDEMPATSFGDVAPADVRLVRVRLTVTGPNPRISPTLSWQGGTFDLAPIVFAYEEPTTADLTRDADVLFNLRGQRVAGKRESRDVSSNLDALAVLGEQDPLVGLLLAAIETKRERELAPITTPFRPHRMLIADVPVAGKPFAFAFELFYDGESPENVLVGFTWGPDISYAGGLKINGVPLDLPDFAVRPRVQIDAVRPGTLIAITCDLQANAPSRAGSLTTVQARTQWDDGSIVAALEPYGVEPGVVAFERLEDLPFRVVSPSGAAALAATWPEEDDDPFGDEARETSLSQTVDDNPLGHDNEPVLPPSGGSALHALEVADAWTPPPFPDAAVPNEEMTDPGLVDPALEPGAAQTTALIAVEPFDESGRERLIGTLARLGVNDGAPNLCAVVGTIQVLAPAALLDTASAPAYAAGLRRLKSDVNAAIMRGLRPNEPMRLRPEEIAAFRAEAEPFALASRDDIPYASVQDGAPSFAACLAAYARLLGKQFQPDSAIARAAEDLGAAFVRYGISIDAYGDADMSVRILRDAPTDLARIAQECYLLLTEVQSAA